MSVTISDELLELADWSADEFMAELAVLLYERGKISIGKAIELAKMERVAFQKLLASREIPLNYDTAEFERDLETLRTLRAS